MTPQSVRAPRMNAPCTSSKPTGPSRPSGPERARSDYAASTKQQRTPGGTPGHQTQNRDSYFAGQSHEEEEEELPPELTEASVGATIRLVYRFQELYDIVSMWQDLRKSVPGCETSDELSAWYIHEVQRSFNFLRRAHADVSLMRNYGQGTEKTTGLEVEIAALIEKVRRWGEQNTAARVQPQSSGSSRTRASEKHSGNSRAPSDKPSIPNSSSSSQSLVVYNPDSTITSGSANSSPQRPKSSQSSQSSASATDPQAAQAPTREDWVVEIRKMNSFMEAVTAAVRNCKLTRDQMENGLRSMRQSLVTAQKDVIRGRREEIEREKIVRTGGALQVVKRN